MNKLNLICNSDDTIKARLDYLEDYFLKIQPVDENHERHLGKILDSLELAIYYYGRIKEDTEENEVELDQGS